MTAAGIMLRQFSHAAVRDEHGGLIGFFLGNGFHHNLDVFTQHKIAPFLLCIRPVLTERKYNPGR